VAARTRKLNTDIFGETSSSSSSDPDDSDPDPAPIPPKKFKIPKHPGGGLSGAEILIMKKQFPQLSSFTEQMFRIFSVKDLLMMDSSSSARKKKDSKILSERLSANLEKLNESPMEVPSGKDNCADLLHEARFLRGARGKSQDVWVAARKKLGLTGFGPGFPLRLKHPGI